MKTLKRIAIVAIASFGILAQAQAQDYTEKFNKAKPDLDGLMRSMQYGEVVEKIRAILPEGIPDFPKDPTNPQLAVTSYFELGSIVDFHECLYKALLASGDTEGAIACIKKAEEIARINAADTKAGLTPTIEVWSAAIQESTKKLEEATPIKAELEAEKGQAEAAKGQLESKKRNKAENKRLADINERLAVVEEDLALLGKDMAVWEDNLKKAPLVMDQLNGYIDAADKDAAKFTQDINDMESDLAAEKDAIGSKYKGNKASYVAAALRNANPSMDQKEKVKFLNRLSVLDPKNAAVRKQLDAAIGKQ